MRHLMTTTAAPGRRPDEVTTTTTTHPHANIANILSSPLSHEWHPSSIILTALLSRIILLKRWKLRSSREGRRRH